MHKNRVLTLLALLLLILTLGQAAAANRQFPLYLKNGFSYPITFKIEPGHCYQGTGAYDRRKLTQGPVAPGAWVKLNMARDQLSDCDGSQGVFSVTTKWDSGESRQGFSFNNAGTLRLRQVPELYAGHLSAKSTGDGSYTWTASDYVTLVTPEHNRLIRIQNTNSSGYLTQTHGGRNDAKRNVTVWNLPLEQDNSFRWIMQDAGAGYWHLINMKTGLALTKDGNDGNVSNWGLTDKNNPNQLWRFERDNNRNVNRYMIINKATNQGLNQAYGGVREDKVNVTVWPNQTFDANGWSWLLHDGGQADLVQLTIQSVKAIKTSTGQGVGTEILFGAIEAAATGLSSAASKVGQKALKLTTGQIIKRQTKQAVQEGVKSAADASAKEVSGVKAYQDAHKDGLKADVRNQNNAVGSAGGTGLDALDAMNDFEKATSLQNAFNTIYGESPDDLNIKVNNVSIWPNGGRDSRKIKSQQTLPVNKTYIFEDTKGLVIDLVEYDSGSGDDSLGRIGFTNNELSQDKLYENVLVRSDSEGSLYQLTFRLSPFAINVANQTESKKWALQSKKWALQDKKSALESKKQRAENKKLEQNHEKERLRRVSEASKATFAEMTLWSTERETRASKTNRLALTRDDPIVSSSLQWERHINLRVTTSSDNRMLDYAYEMAYPGRAIYDDVSGDPNDLIKTISTDDNTGTYLRATGKATGKATLHVSFADSPGVTASLTVEVVSDQPPPINLSGNWSGRYGCPTGQMLRMVTIHHQREEVVASAFSDGCLNANVKVWSGALDKDLKGNVTCSKVYDEGSGIYAVKDVPGRIEVFNENYLIACSMIYERMGPDDVMQMKQIIASDRQVPSSSLRVASKGINSASIAITQFTLLNDSNFAWHINWIDYQGAQSQTASGRVAIQPGQLWEIKNGGAYSDTYESHWYAISYQGEFLCSISLRVGASVKYSELSACQQSVSGSNSPAAQAAAQASQSPATNSIAQFYNAWVSELKADISLPATLDIFELTKIYSICAAGCEWQYEHPTLAFDLRMPNHSQQQVPNLDAVTGQLKDLFLPEFCSSDQKEKGGTITLVLYDRDGTRLATPKLTAADCTSDSPPSSTAAQAPATNAVAQFYNAWVSELKADANLPTTIDIFELTKIYSVCAVGCERQYEHPTLALDLRMPNHSQQQVPNLDAVTGQLKDLFLPDFCSSDAKEKGGTITLVLFDRNGTRLATPKLTPADCTADSPAAQAPATNAVAQFYNAWVSELKADANLPTTIDIFELTKIYSVCAVGCERQYEHPTLALDLRMPNHSQQQVPNLDAVTGQLKDLFLPDFCSSDAKEKGGTITLVLHDRDGTRLATPKLTPADCTADSPAAQAPATNAVAQFYNAWVSELKADANLPTTIDIFELTKIYSVCAAGCERQYEHPTLALDLRMPNHSQQQVPNLDAVTGQLKDLFLPDFCSSDAKEKGGTITLVLHDRDGTRLATPKLTAADCTAA
jgi:hypothetical protein